MFEDQFVHVPETVLPGGRIVPAFEVGQYPTTRYSVDGSLAICADGAPWVSIDYHQSNREAETAGYKLIRESQWLALAYQIAAQDDNWTGGKVGEGKLYQGLRMGSVRSGQIGTYEPRDKDERTWFVLPGGERIYHLAGNVYEWVFDDVQGDDKGLIAKPFTADSPSLVIPYPAEDKGQGWTPRAGTDWSGNALIRGGCWRSGSSAGAFRLDFGWPVSERGSVGFRCTKPVGL